MFALSENELISWPVWTVCYILRFDAMYSQYLVPYETHDAPQLNLGHPMRAFVPWAVLTANYVTVVLNIWSEELYGHTMYIDRPIPKSTIFSISMLIKLYDDDDFDDDDDVVADDYDDADFNLDLNFQTIDCFQIWFCDTPPVVYFQSFSFNFPT
jgi:hypothetical protein